MKKLQLLALCGLVIQASSLFGSEKRVMRRLYKPLDFDNPVRDPKVSGISPKNDPKPSKVGFFNGDIEQYEKDLLEKYPDGSCMKAICDDSDECSKFGSNKTVSCTEDCSSGERHEHYLQDIAAHQKISESFGTVPDLQDRSIKATNIRNLSKAICCWGMTYFFPEQIDVEKITDQKVAATQKAFIEKVKTVREKKYLELKKENSETFLDARNNLLGNLIDQERQTLKNELEVAYNELKDKVQLKMTANRLTKEARWYQAGIALQVLAVGTAIYNRKALAQYAGYGLAKFMSLKK